MSQATPVPARTKTDDGGQPILRARGIRKEFRMGEADVQVLKNVDLTVRRGEFIAIEGRSGSGKSTLLHILGALDSVNGGAVEFEGFDYTRVARPSEGWVVGLLAGRALTWIRRATLGAAIALWLVHELADVDWAGRAAIAIFVGWAVLFLAFLVALGIRLVRGIQAWREEGKAAKFRNKDFGFVFQFYHLLPELSVLENTLLGPMIENDVLSYTARQAELRAKAEVLLADLGMGHRLSHRPAQLSGGERQRVAIARALMNEPKVLFADEPTGNLDFETGAQIMKVLENLHQTRGQTIVMVTHDRTLARQADRVLVLREGRLERADER